MTIIISESNVKDRAQQMEKTIEMSDQNETETLTFEDTTSNDEWIRPNSLNFPWPLIDLVINFKEVFKTKSNLFKHLLYSFYFQLLVLLIICIVCIAVGAAFRTQYYGNRMLYIVFFVQGICGLLSIMLHTCAIVFPWIRSLMTNLSCDERLVKRYLITSAHLLTIFLIFWFFLGHIWFIGEIVGDYSYYGNTIHVFTIIMVPVQYVVGVWLLYCCIWNNSRVLPRPGKNIQHLPDQSPNKNEYLNTKETTICQKPVDSNINIDQYLTIT